MAGRKSRYEWKRRGWSLAIPGDKNPRHEVVLVRRGVLLEMLEGDWLTGQAKVDAEKERKESR